MTNRRSKLEIYVDILEKINMGVIKPTRIMYEANLSWKPLQQILKSLISQELIIECTTEDKDKRTKKAYQLTEKGINVLRYFNKAKELVKSEHGLELQSWM
jgi:predicted transcriptional regulator